MAMEELLAHIRDDAKDLRHEFEKASRQGRGTPQEISDFRENALQALLQNYFPFPYRIAKGGILDATGNRSDSIDCILVNPHHPYTIDRRQKFKLILTDGVDAAIEVKPDISRRDELRRGLEQGLTVKALRRARSPIIRIGEQDEERTDYFLRTPYYIFAMRAKGNILDTAHEVIQFYEDEEITPLNQADAIVVDRVGILANFPIEGLFTWSRKDGRENDQYIDRNTGWFFEEWRDNTLAGLLFKLSRAVPGRATLQAPIIQEYLSRAPITSLVQLPAHPEAYEYYKQQTKRSRGS
jgi:uncharacterized protein DUF6602